MSLETSSYLESNIDIAWMKRLIRQAGEVGLRHFNNTEAKIKADRSLVTVADQEIERFLVTKLAQRFPDWAFLGEEYGLQGNSPYLWAIDPIDGTAAFSCGLPVWGVSVGLLTGERPVAGWFYLPLTDELYAVGPTGSPTWNDNPIDVTTGQTVDNNSLITAPSDAHRHFDIRWPGKVRSLGSVAAHIAYVARGMAVGSLVGRPHLWDVAGALAILERAGGIVCTLDGEPWELSPMLSGERRPEPMVVAAPQFMTALLSNIKATTPFSNRV